MSSYSRTYLHLIVTTLCLAAVSWAQPAAMPNGSAKAAGPGDDPAVTRVGNVDVPSYKLRPVTIPKMGETITIDGRLDESVWQSAAVFKDFYQTSPGNNTPASRPTEAYMMYDEKNLYIGFKCWDERDKIRASVAKRDNVFGEDNVRVWLDTYNDRRRAYVLGFNPLGIQQDGIFTEGQGGDFSVDIVMESKGVIEDWGWSVEVKIPFKSIRYAPGKGRQWGFNVARNIDRFNDEFDQWLPDDRNVSGFLVKHGRITGLDEIKYERTLEIVPSVTLSETGKRERTIPRSDLGPMSVDPGRFVNHPIKPDLGVTLKYTLSPSVTLDAAINPDFAEIEADAPVVTANQRFPIYFQEKRPFFLEGADIFRSPLQVFYSRNIVDPDAAVKLTGKLGKTSFGILAAADKAPGNYDIDDRNDRLTRPRIDEFLDKRAYFGVLRLKRDFGRENNIGLFATYRGFPEQKNLLAGVDGKLKLSPRTTAVFQVVGTNSRRCIFDATFEPTLDPDQALRNRQICGGGSFGGVTVLGSPYNRYRTGNGVGYYANLDYTTEKHGFFLEAGGRSRYYRADSGFTRRTNTNFAFFYNRFSTRSDAKRAIIRASSGQYVGVDYDFNGRLQSFNIGGNLNLSLQRNTYVSLEANTSFEKIFEEEFGLKRMPTRPLGTFFGDPTRSAWQQSINGNINQTLSKRINYGAAFGYARKAFDFFYFEPNGQQNPGTGQEFAAGVYLEYKPINALRISANYDKRRFVRDDNRVRSFDTDLITLRSTYQFTRFIFTRARLDYDSSNRNYSGQVLFGWNPNPGTAFYVGYNDNFNYNGLSPFTGQLEPGFERNSRTFFIRASYLFRKSF